MNGRPINMMRAETSDSALWRGALELQLQQTLTGEESAGCPGHLWDVIVTQPHHGGARRLEVESQTRSLVEQPPQAPAERFCKNSKGVSVSNCASRVHQQPWAAPNNAAAGVVRPAPAHFEVLPLVSSRDPRCVNMQRGTRW